MYDKNFSLKEKLYPFQHGLKSVKFQAAEKPQKGSELRELSIRAGHFLSSILLPQFPLKQLVQYGPKSFYISTDLTKAGVLPQPQVGPSLASPTTPSSTQKALQGPLRPMSPL